MSTLFTNLACSPHLVNASGVLLGEEKAMAFVMIHMKGAGPTPYSRRGDGPLTRSCIREYLASESMAALSGTIFTSSSAYA